jgi:hypothetical protein
LNFSKKLPEVKYVSPYGRKFAQIWSPWLPLKTLHNGGVAGNSRRKLDEFETNNIRKTGPTENWAAQNAVGSNPTGADNVDIAGVDVMITIFCEFRLFSAKNWRFS